MMRQLMQSRCCCLNMLTATCQPSVCGRTKSGTGISIDGQALYTSLILQIKLATLIMKVSQIHKRKGLYSLFLHIDPLGPKIHSVIFYGEKGTVMMNME